MTEAQTEVGKIKSELDKYQKKLLQLENKWSVASIVQRLSSHDQSRLLKATVASKKLTSTMIPNLKCKIESWAKTKDGRLLREALADYDVINNKAQWAINKFNKLESGDQRQVKSFKNELDKALSLSIEKSLKLRKKSGLSSTKMCSLTGNKQESITTAKSMDTGGTTRAEKLASRLNLAGCSRDKLVNEQLHGGGDVGDDLSEVDYGYLDLEEEKLLKQLQGSLTTEDFSRFMQSKQPVRGWDDLNCQQDKKEEALHRKRRMKKSDSQKKGVDDARKLSSKEEKPIRLKAQVPSPIPIDSFLNFIESMPNEIQSIVKEQTDSLCSLQEDGIFSKNKLSSRKGRMVSMDHLKEEYSDERFDASDFHIRVPDSMIDSSHLNWIKEQKVDDAVERYFGSFKREKPKLKGSFLDAIQEDDYLERIPDYSAPDLEEDPAELLEKYHLERVDVLRRLDSTANEDGH